MSENATFQGLVSPVPVPLNDHGAVRLEDVPASARFTIDCGADAVIAAGTAVAQELTALTVSEREDLVEATVDAVDGRVPVFAGVSHPALPVVDRLVEHAESVGAEGLFLMPPWGIPPDDETVVRYFEHVADRSDRPIFLYNNPTVSVDLSAEMIARLVEIDSVCYIKESSRNWRKLSWLFDEVHENGQVHLFTTLHVLLTSLQYGGAGVTLPPPATAVARDVVEAHEREDQEAAIEAQRALAQFPPRGTRLNATMRAAMEIAGVEVGPPRPPYPAASESVRDHLREWLDEVELP
jgi:4-hydroxy-tetrahydrodipicolinate synthase